MIPLNCYKYGFMPSIKFVRTINLLMTMRMASQNADSRKISAKLKTTLLTTVTFRINVIFLDERST